MILKLIYINYKEFEFTYTFKFFFKQINGTFVWKNFSGKDSMEIVNAWTSERIVLGG